MCNSQINISDFKPATTTSQPAVESGNNTSVFRIIFTFITINSTTVCFKYLHLVIYII